MPRRSRAYRRFHTDRVVAKRVAQAKREAWFKSPHWEPTRGRVEDEQWYLGCHRPRCGICHPEKRWNYGDREREERDWQRDWGL